MRYAVRALLKTPAYTLIALLTLALGIGANTAIFSVVNQVLLNPAGVSDPSRVVSLRVKYDKLALRNIGVSIPDFADVLHSTQQFESAALIETGDFNYTASGLPERLNGASVSYRWFDVFGARPLVGRTFQAEEDKPDANREVVLSFAAWKRLFGEDRAAVGRSIELNQTPYRIVGVMRTDFRWPADIDLWVPLGLAANQYRENNRFNENYEAVARLRPRVPFASANAFVGVLSDRVKSAGDRHAAYAKDSAWGMFLLPFTDYVAGDTRTPMLVLAAAVGFVLLIACANIAGLMLARASGRTREIAVRAALGASRWNLIRQSFCESIVLAAAGAAAGVAVAIAGVRGLLALAPEGLPVAVSVRLDAPMLTFAVFAAAAAGLIFGVGPAWQVSRMKQFELLKEGGRANSAGRARQQLRSSLVVAEVALALVLLVGAGLFLRSLAALEDVNPGFQSAGVITGGLTLPHTRYDSDAKQLAFYQAVLENLSATPGVAAVAAGIPLPFSGNGASASFDIDGRPSPPGDPGPHGDLGAVSADYFAALKIPIRQGRVFSAVDRAGTEQVAVIDDVLARQYWPGQNAVGQHIRRGSNSQWATIVGVVGHVKHSDLAGEDVKGKYYFPITQMPLPFMSFLMRAPSDPGRLSTALRDAVRAVDPTEPISQIRLMSAMVNSSLAPRRFVVTVLGVFAGMALALALIGLYGLISYAVTQRTQELGVRMALGAEPAEILRLVLAQAMKLAGIGAAAGLAVSLAMSRFLRGELFHVSAFDPLTFLLMGAALIAAALIASYIPARRATRVDPMVALRYE
jgi:predicted permease